MRFPIAGPGRKATHGQRLLPIEVGGVAKAASQAGTHDGSRDLSLAGVAGPVGDIVGVLLRELVSHGAGGVVLDRAPSQPAPLPVLIADAIPVDFESDLNKTESSIPVVSEYLLTAGNKKRWNTAADWQKGGFSQAVGHQSVDVYMNHARDFDDYSGKASDPDAK